MLPADTSARQSANSPSRSLPTNLPLPGSSPSSPAAHNTAAPLLPNARLFLPCWFHPLSRPLSVLAAVAPVARRPALAAAGRHLSRAIARRSDAATHACAAPDREPAVPPWARHSFVRPPTIDPCSNSATAHYDRHAPQRAPATPYRLRGVFPVTLAPEIFQPPKHFN